MERIGNTEYYCCEDAHLLKLVNSTTGEWNVLPKSDLTLPTKTTNGDWNPAFIKYIGNGLFKQLVSHVEMPCHDKFNLVMPIKS